jgi:subtilisin family serine protease
MQRLAELAAACLLTGVWAVVLPAAAGAERSDGSLCGLVRPLDDLLRCRAPAPSAPAPPQEPATEQQQQEETHATSAASLPVQPPPVIDPQPRFVDDTLLVRFRAGVSAQQKQAALDGAGVTAVRSIRALGVTVVRMPPARRDEALASLRRSPVVAHAERDAVLERVETTPNDTDWPQQWGLRRIGLPAAWDVTRGRSSITVAVLDTGVDGRTPDLRDAVVPGYNAVVPTAPPSDDNGHGTSVAGIIAARTNNDQGIAGICWTCTVLAIKVLGPDGTGDTALVAAGIVRAADAGARVISMSLGGPADDETLDQAVGYALAKGAIVVAAAGNNGSSAPFYPAAIAGVVGVAATDETDRLYPWSNFGSWVQVAAPGCNPAPSSTGGDVMFCGTSAAAPVVAGLIALQLSEQPGEGRDAILAALEGTAVPLGGAVRFGRVDARAALAALADVPTQASSPSTTEAQKFAVTVRGALRGGRVIVRRTIPSGRLAITLTSQRAPTLELAIVSARGARTVHVRGRSPLRLLRPLTGGTYSFVIRAPKPRLPFVLELRET